MGVSGLTTFLREGRNSLATSLVIEQSIQHDDPDLECRQARQRVFEPGEDEVPLVIDAWGFMWGLYPGNLKWTTGGDYLAFSKLVKRFLEALDVLHCRPYFVFDGPTPAAKHETVIQRYAAPLRSSLLFYRTSPHSRSHKSFLAHQPILPPFLLQAFVDTLHAHGLVDGVQVFHLPEGEADAYCVALADELEGFVVGNDSDFAILGAKATAGGGYKGYIPIEMMQWQVQVAMSNGDAQDGVAASADDGFQPVRSKKSKSSALKVTERNQTVTTATSLHVLPPALPPAETISEASTTCTLSLFLTVFTPTALATRLRIPPSYLPLFATILGTDHSPTTTQGRSPFFEDSLAKRERVEVVARVIREALVPGNLTRMRKRLGTVMGSSGRNTPSVRVVVNAGDEAFSFVALVVGNLLARPSANEDTFMELVTAMIEATCHYILPPSPSTLGLYSVETLSGRPNLGSCCASFPFCECSADVAPLSASTDLVPLHDADTQQHVRRRYALARNAGRLTSFASFVQPDRVYLKSYLQDPEGVYLSGLDGSKRIRAEAWRVLISNLYLFPVSRPDVFAEGDDIQPDDESDAPTDMVEESSEIPENREEFVLEKADDPDSDSGLWITEYYRLGASQNLGPHDNILFAGTSSLPAGDCSMTSEPSVRRKHFLAVLDSDTPEVAALEPKWQLLAALIRHAIRLQQESRNSNRKTWTTTEVERMVDAAMRSSAAWSEVDAQVPTEVLLQTRNVDIVAHVTAAAGDVLALSQAFLLEDAPVYQFLEGSIWHETLEGHSPGLTNHALKTAIVQAVVEGFDVRYLLGVGESNKPKRERPASPVATPPRAKKTAVKPSRGHGRYDLLMEE